MNKYLSIIIFVLGVSCHTKNHILKNHHDFLLDELSIENIYEANLTEPKILYKKAHYNYISTVEKLAIQYYTIDSLILNTKQWSHQNLFDFRNNLLFNIGHYNEGKRHYVIDTVKLNLSTANPKDTSLLNTIISTTNYLQQTLNSKQIKLQLSYLNLKSLFMKYNRIWTCGFGSSGLKSKVKYPNKLFYKNERAYIIPGLFEIDGYKDAQIYIFKENSTEFINENGERKTFTNPITLKASSTRGVHTVKGVIMIKHKGELAPKPFEFRYIVE